MMNVSKPRIALIVAVIGVIMVAGVSYQSGWVGPPHRTSSSTVITETTFTRQATFSVNSTEVQIVSVNADFGKIQPSSQLSSAWDYSFAVVTTWKNVSPKTMYFLVVCLTGNIGGTILPTSTANATDLLYTVTCRHVGMIVALNPGDQFTTTFRGNNGAGLVVKGTGTVDMRLTLNWSNFPGAPYSTYRGLNFTASFDI